MCHFYRRAPLPINLFFCGVHGDETSAVYPCFHLVRELIFDNPDVLKRFKVVVAPLINPDGFFAKTRGNSRGVDPNRNLPTKDWEIAAKKVWGKYNYDLRKNPGDSPGSEVESKFQVFLINKYKPDKIISMHAPYGFIDFDGPGDRRYYNLIRIEQRAKFLALNIEANSKKFLKVVDYRFFPGSLGNYAGNERKIPTYTLELPSVSYLKAPYYWNILSFALIKALDFKVYDENETNPFLQMEPILSDVGKKD